MSRCKWWWILCLGLVIVLAGSVWACSEPSPAAENTPESGEQEDQGTAQAGESDEEPVPQAGPDYREFDGIFVFFRPRDVGAYRELLPDVFDMPDTPLVEAFVMDYYKMDPSFIQPYLEGAIFLLAEYRGQEAWHCITMPVTTEEARWGGVYYLGYPKVIGDISLERDGPDYTGIVNLDGVTVMTVSLGTEGHVITEEEEQWFQDLTGIPQLNILRGRIIDPLPGIAKETTSLLQWSRTLSATRLVLKVGKAELSLQSGATEKHPGKEYYAFGIQPDEIVLAYYHANKFGFSFGRIERR